MQKKKKIEWNKKKKERKGRKLNSIALHLENSTIVMDLCNHFDYVASNRRLMSRTAFYRDVWRIESALASRLLLFYRSLIRRPSPTRNQSPLSPSPLFSPQCRKKIRDARRLLVPKIGKWGFLSVGELFRRLFQKRFHKSFRNRTKEDVLC